MNSTVSTWTCMLSMPTEGLYFFAGLVIKSRMHPFWINIGFCYCDYAWCRKDNNLQSEILLLTDWYGCAIGQVISHQLLIPDAPFQSQGSPCGICGGQSGTGADSNLNTSDLPCQILFHQCPILICYQGLVQQAPFRPQYHETQFHLTSTNRLKCYYIYFQ
jgi:hypothetical protein